MAGLFSVPLPVTMLNGSYTGSMLEVSNTLGSNAEDITMGYYAASAGMAIAYPIVPKVLGAVSSKVLLLADLTLQFLLSWFCARSQSADTLIVCSFFIGFLKGFLMLWCIRRIKTIFSPKDVRSEFYAYFYPLVFGCGQLSMIITAELAYHYDWKYMYYFMMILLLAALLMVAICFRHDRPLRRIPLRELHVREMFVASAGLLMLMYVLCYGKVLDWLSSPRICLYVVLGPALLVFFLRTQHRSRNPYVDLAPLRQPKALVGYLYMMIVMFFSTSTTLLTNYMTSILQVDATHSYTLYVWLLPGYALGAFVCFWWFRWQRWRFRFLIAGGMACFALFFGLLYFGISPGSTYQSLFFPVFVRGADADAHHRLRTVRRRGVEPQIPDLQRLFPNRLPLGAGSCHGRLVLRQRTLPLAAEISLLALGALHADGPGRRSEIRRSAGLLAGTGTRIRRSGATGDRRALFDPPTAKSAAGPQGYSGVAVRRFAAPRRRFAVHPVPQNHPRKIRQGRRRHGVILAGRRVSGIRPVRRSFRRSLPRTAPPRPPPRGRRD